MQDLHNEGNELMSDIPPPIPPELPPAGTTEAPKQDFYFHEPPQELKPELDGAGKAFLVILHLVGMAILVFLNLDSAPASMNESMQFGYVVGRIVSSFIFACILFLVARMPFKSANPNVAQPLVLMVCYGIVIAYSLSSVSLGGKIDKTVANSKNQEAISQLKKKTEALVRKDSKRLDEDIPIAADPSDMKLRKDAWDEMVANVDTEGMTETDKRMFAATQVIMGTLMEAGEKFATAAAAAGDLTLNNIETSEDVNATKARVVATRSANVEMAEYMKGLPDLIEETMEGHGVPKREIAAFTTQFLTAMAYESQLKVRELEDQRMDTLSVILDLLTHHEGTWELTDGEFLFEDDQAIEDFNVLMGEIDRIEGELVEQQEAIMNAAAKAQTGVR